ncbi:MAG: SCP2 sterol-binding domain-containing protein [Candidatus Hodarchaeales archaeon]
MGIEKLKEFADAINANDEVKAMLKGWVKIAGYEVDGEHCYIEHKEDGSCEFHEGKPEKANFTMKGSADVFEKMFTGELDAQKAFFAKQYQIEGDVMGTMKLLPVIKKLKK